MGSFVKNFTIFLCSASCLLGHNIFDIQPKQHDYEIDQQKFIQKAKNKDQQCISQLIHDTQNAIVSAPDKNSMLQSFNNIDLDNMLESFQSKPYQQYTDQEMLNFLVTQKIFNDEKITIPDHTLFEYFPLGIAWNHIKYNKNPDKNFKNSLSLTGQLAYNLCYSKHALCYGFGHLFPHLTACDHYLYFYDYGFVAHLAQAKIIKKIIDFERISHAQGCEVFYHARRWSWNLVNDICNFIISLKLPELYIPSRISLRFRDKNCNVALLRQWQQELVASGPSESVNSGLDPWLSEKSREITCLNHTVISNATYNGECTGQYLTDCMSQAQYDAETKFIESLLAQYDLRKFFEPYLAEIKDMIQVHAQACEFGELLAIAIKQPYINELTYPARGFCFKEPGTTTDKIAQTKQNACNQDDFVDDIHKFYCFAVSDIPGDYGTKYFIQSIHNADPSKYTQYQQKRDALFAKVKQAYLQSLAPKPTPAPQPAPEPTPAKKKPTKKKKK